MRALSDDDIGSPKGSSDTTDYVLERYKKQIQMMEEAKKTYDELVASGYTKADALAKTKGMFDGKMGKMNVPTNSKELIANYNEAIRLLKTRKKTEDDVFEIQLNILGVEKEDAQQKMKEYIDAMQSEFDNSKKRISFFDDLVS